MPAAPKPAPAPEAPGKSSARPADPDLADSPSALDRLATWSQLSLPHHPLSRAMHALARSRNALLRRALIGYFLHRFGIDLSEAEREEPARYRSLNDFFTRALKPGARPLDPDPRALLSPVDGSVSQAGTLSGNSLLQAKDHRFDLAALLGGSEERAAPFRDGSFATLYLSPRDYHRVHAPVDMRVRELVYVPGRLFSVNPATTRALPRLFARNERLAVLAETPAGPLALVMVGALFVGSIELVWAGELTPPPGRRIRSWSYGQAAERPELARGAELGRFNLGSTVILVFGRDAVDVNEELLPGARLRMGESIGRMRERSAEI